MWRVAATALVAMAYLTGPALAQGKQAPQDAKVYIIWPKNGQTIHGAFWLRMGLKGMGICPAGTDRPNTGHHHVLIDTEIPPADQALPNDRNHLHFGGGQTEARIELPPGKHTLQLVLADAKHYQFTPSLVSERIAITVR